MAVISSVQVFCETMIVFFFKSLMLLSYLAWSNYFVILFFFQIKKKNSVIRKLQADLRQIEKFSDENNKRVTNEAEKQEQADLKNSEGKKQRLMTELNQLKTQLQNAVMEHRENEQELRRVCVVTEHVEQ